MDYLSGMDSNEFRITSCAVDDLDDALRLLYSGLSPDQQTALPPTLDSVREQGFAAFSGLLVASRSQELVGVVWVQLAPGRTAILWPPAAGGIASPDLMRAAATFLDENEVALAQILIDPNVPHDTETFEVGGFSRLVELKYLAIPQELFPASATPSELEFAPAASVQPQRYQELLLETYDQTLDCPTLNGVRDPQDVLAGYAAQGQYSADLWYVVQHRGQDVGVLILSKYSDGETWELVYMGVVPSARGDGFGRQIVGFALAQAAAGEAKKLILAVDRENTPALAMYHDAGFTAWDARTVYARLNRR